MKKWIVWVVFMLTLFLLLSGCAQPQPKTPKSELMAAAEPPPELVMPKRFLALAQHWLRHREVAAAGYSFKNKHTGEEYEGLAVPNLAMWDWFVKEQPVSEPTFASDDWGIFYWELDRK